jgi:hypothetical protein
MPQHILESQETEEEKHQALETKIEFMKNVKEGMEKKAALEEEGEERV